MLLLEVPGQQPTGALVETARAWWTFRGKPFLPARQCTKHTIILLKQARNPVGDFPMTFSPVPFSQQKLPSRSAVPTAAMPPLGANNRSGEILWQETGRGGRSRSFSSHAPFPIMTPWLRLLHKNQLGKHHYVLKCCAV